MKTNYVLITPARNEGKFLESTILSVISQTHQPSEWIIVNDNSTDETGNIINKYSAEISYIKGINYPGDVKRSFSSKVMAFNFGYSNLSIEDYQFIGCLDADITYENNYYEMILYKFVEYNNLGIAGGYVREPSKSGFKVRKLNKPYSMPNSIQMLHRRCYEDIGGFLPLKYGGEDVAAEVLARYKGWHVMAFENIPVYHHRVASSAQGLIKGVYKQGKMDYGLGNPFLLEILKCGRRFFTPPLFVGSLLRFLGYTVSSLMHEKRIVDKKFVKCYRKEQYIKFRFWISKFPIFSNNDKLNINDLL